MRKLQLGAGSNILHGWTNTDGGYHDGLRSIGPHVELRQPLPFADGSWDRIFSEHVHEHLTRPDGDRLLRECHRVLAPGGRIRVGVPDLGMVLRLFDDPSTWTEDMRAWAALCAQYHGAQTACQILNWLVQMGLDEGPACPYPHRFQYTEGELRAALEAAGFVEVRRYPVGVSDDPELRGIEHVSRLPEGMLNVETLVLEAVRP